MGATLVNISSGAQSRSSGMAEGVMVIDRRGRVRTANPAARRLLAAQGLLPPAPFQLRGVPSWLDLIKAVENALGNPQRDGCHFAYEFMHTGTTFEVPMWTVGAGGTNLRVLVNDAVGGTAAVPITGHTAAVPGYGMSSLMRTKWSSNAAMRSGSVIAASRVPSLRFARSTMCWCTRMARSISPRRR